MNIRRIKLWLIPKKFIQRFKIFATLEYFP
jgi:hypothetical protein